MKIMVTSFKRHNARTAAFSAPDPIAGHCRPTPLPVFLDTHGQVWVSPLWGHCSFILGPGVCKVLFVPSKRLFPQSCVKFWLLSCGVNGDLFQEAYAIPKSGAPRAPTLAAVHC